MPLSALTQYGQLLIERKILPPLGWSRTRVSFAIQLDNDGQIVGVRDLRETVTYGTNEKAKEVKIAPYLNVPYRSTHEASIHAFCLCDNSRYMLGLGDGIKNESRIPFMFEDCIKEHKALLAQCSGRTATALKKFFATWIPDNASNVPCLMENMEALTADVNILFEVDGVYAHEDVEIASAWDEYYVKCMYAEAVGIGTCMVTGEQNVPLTRLHPKVTGVHAAKSTGAPLVMYGDPNSSYCFGDKVQGENIPIASTTAALYGSALNYLLKTREHHVIIGDTTICFWAADGNDNASEMFAMGAFGRQKMVFDTPEDEALYQAMSAMKQGKITANMYKEYALDATAQFFVLGIRPHGEARLGVAFFLKSTFGEMFETIENHYQLTEIMQSRNPQPTRFPPDVLLQAIGVPGKEGKFKSNTSASMEDSLSRAIITGTKYPSMLVNRVLERISVDRTITAPRVAILKATLLRNGYKNPEMKEVLTVEQNDNCTYPPYILGQMFSWVEGLQVTAIPRIQRTVRDLSFGTAQKRPAQFFAITETKIAYYISKLKRNTDTAGLGYYYERMLNELHSKLPPVLPSQLTREEQMAFIIGYHHATQRRFTSTKPTEEAQNKEEI